MMTDTEMEMRLREALSRLPAPGPSPEQLDQIIRRRAAGDRPLLLRGRGRGRVWTRWIGLSAVAACLALVVGRTDPTRKGEPGTQVPAQSGNGAHDEESQDRPFFPAALMAQSAPTFPVMAAYASPRLQPGRWWYAFYRDSIAISPDSLSVRAIERGEYEGQPAWVFLSGRGGRSSQPRWSDTTWSTIDSLRPLARHTFLEGGGEIEEYYRDDEILTGYRAGGSISWSKTVIEDPSPTLKVGVMRQWHPLHAALMAAPLTSSWKGSVPMLTRIGRGSASLRWWNLSVVGEEALTTPAGRFQCWKVGVNAGSIGNQHFFGTSPMFYYWVSQDRGWVVKEGTDGRPELPKYRLELVRAEP